MLAVCMSWTYSAFEQAVRARTVQEGFSLPAHQ